MGVVAVADAENVQPHSDTETSSVGDLVIHKEPQSPGPATPSGPAGPRLTEQTLTKLLRSDPRNYYQTKELNEKLFIHYGGYRRLENLEGFTGLRVLYGECNSFTCIEGLDECRELRSLFVNQNCIRKIDNLHHNLQLWSVNLSDNFIEKIENIAHLTNLNTLIIANNSVGANGLGDLEGLAGLGLCVLDIQGNKIDDEQVVDDIFTTMPNLAVLYLKNNPVVKKIQNYRKTLINKLPKLKFLDDRPVFDDERRLAAAFARGGLEEERAERRVIQQEKDDEYRRNSDAFDAMIEAAKSAHKEALAMRAIDRYNSETSDPVDTLEKKQKKWYEANLDISDPPPNIEKVNIPCVAQSANEAKANQEAGAPISWDEPIFEASEPVTKYEFQPPARGEVQATRMVIEEEEMPPLEPVSLDEMD